jgi:hypothetical protein
MNAIEAATADAPAIAQELWDRQQITDVMVRFGQGLDLHDWALFESVLAEPLEIDSPSMTAGAVIKTTPALWTRFTRACLEKLDVLHVYSNYLITVTGDTAEGVIYHTSHLWGHTRHGEDRFVQYGWYENAFRRDSGTWKISRLRHLFQWCEGNPTLVAVGDSDWKEAAEAVFGAGTPALRGAWAEGATGLE